MYRFIWWIQNWKNKSKDPFVILKFIFYLLIFYDFFYVILKDFIINFLMIKCLGTVYSWTKFVFKTIIFHNLHELYSCLHRNLSQLQNFKILKQNGEKKSNDITEQQKKLVSVLVPVLWNQIHWIWIWIQYFGPIWIRIQV